MKIKRGTQKLKRNSKTTNIKCFRCGQNKKVLRNDTIFCSDLCRVQEHNFRTENGYMTKAKFEGKEHEWKSFFGYPRGIHEKYSPLIKDYSLIDTFISTAPKDQSWKKEFIGFVVYYFHNLKLKPFQIYFTADKFKTIANFQKLNKKSLGGYRRVEGK